MEAPPPFPFPNVHFLPGHFTDCSRKIWSTTHARHSFFTKSFPVFLREDYVDGVEILLRHEEDTHDEGSPYSWEIMEESVANFTCDITPLILAAHR